MPTQRFYNLPAAKRDRITAAAMEEFIANGYEGADVAGVVRRAGIPRGSFYQYFAGMDDLMTHVFDHVTRIKAALMCDILARAGELSFANYVEESFHAGVRLAESQPQMMALGKSLYSSTNPVIVRAIAAARQTGIEHYLPLIERDKARGLIRSSVDSRTLAEFITAVFTDIVGAMMLGETAGKSRSMVMADTMFDILRHGIQTK